MPKYLLEARYVGDGLKAMMKEGGSKRRAAAKKAIESVGGTLEAFYFGFGSTDAYVVADVPDNVSMAAVALRINASGLVTTSTTALLTPEEVDAAVKKKAAYRAPGE